MIFIDPIEFHLEEKPYRDHIDSYQRTNLTEIVQIGQLNGIPSNWDYGFSAHGR